MASAGVILVEYVWIFTGLLDRLPHVGQIRALTKFPGWGVGLKVHLSPTPHMVASFALSGLIALALPPFRRPEGWSVDQRAKALLTI